MQRPEARQDAAAVAARGARAGSSRLRLSAGRVSPLTPEARDEAATGRTIGEVVRRRAVLEAAPAATSEPTARELRTARQSIARENLLASALPVTDVRWMLAMKVQHELEGGRAALLRPEKRKRLITEAKELGLRPFDANLVIAIVQDQTRLGLQPVGADFSSRLTMVGAPIAESTRRSERSTVVAAVVCAAAIALGAIYFAARWIVWSS